MRPEIIAKVERLAREGATPGERAAAQAALDRIRARQARRRTEAPRQTSASSAPGAWTFANASTTTGALTMEELYKLLRQMSISFPNPDPIEYRVYRTPKTPTS